MYDERETHSVQVYVSGASRQQVWTGLPAGRYKMKLRSYVVEHDHNTDELIRIRSEVLHCERTNTRDIILANNNHDAKYVNILLSDIDTTGYIDIEILDLAGALYAHDIDLVLYLDAKLISP